MHRLGLNMAGWSDPVRWLRQWAQRQSSGLPVLHESRKPRLTPEEARRDHRQMLRYLALHALVGVTIGAAVGVALILLDVGGLRGLISRASNPVLPFLLVIVPFASLFGGAVTASAILTLPYESKYRQEQDDSVDQQDGEQ